MLRPKTYSYSTPWLQSHQHYCWITSFDYSLVPSHNLLTWVITMASWLVSPSVLLFHHPVYSSHTIVTLTLLRQKSNHVTPLKTLQSPANEPIYNHCYYPDNISYNNPQTHFPSATLTVLLFLKHWHVPPLGISHWLTPLPGMLFLETSGWLALSQSW